MKNKEEQVGGGALKGGEYYNGTAKNHSQIILNTFIKSLKAQKKTNSTIIIVPGDFSQSEFAGTQFQHLPGGAALAF